MDYYEVYNLFVYVIKYIIYCIGIIFEVLVYVIVLECWDLMMISLVI